MSVGGRVKENITEYDLTQEQFDLVQDYDTAIASLTNKKEGAVMMILRMAGLQGQWGHTPGSRKLVKSQEPAPTGPVPVK